MTRIFTAGLAALLVLGLGLAPAVQSAGVADTKGTIERVKNDYDFTATYFLDPATGSVVGYLQEGVLTKAVWCPDDSWVLSSTSIAPTGFGDYVKISMSSTLGAYLIQEKRGTDMTRTTATCGVAPSLTDITQSCSYGRHWTATENLENVGDTADAFLPGWIYRGGPTPQSASGGDPNDQKKQKMEHNADLRYYHYTVTYEVGPPGSNFPFTGRVYVEEPGTSADGEENLISHGYLAGFCIPASISPLPQLPNCCSPVTWPKGCCNYRATVHSIDLGARPTAFGAPPLGLFQQHVWVCNSVCEDRPPGLNVL